MRDSSQRRQTVRQNLTLQIAPAAIVVTPASVPATVVGAAYQVPLTATGGSKPYSWSVTNGALPPGLQLKAGGNLTGKATAPGTYAFMVRATDKSGFTGDLAYSIAVGPAVQLLTTSLPDGTVGVAVPAS